MLWYVIKRVVWAVPTVLVITLIGFILLSAAPGDPVDKMAVQVSSSGRANTAAETEAIRQAWRHRLGLDLPLFYMSVTKWSLPDTLYRMHDTYLKKAYLGFINQYGNRDAVARYYACINTCRQAMLQLPHNADTSRATIHLQNIFFSLCYQTATPQLTGTLNECRLLAKQLAFPSVLSATDSLTAAYQSLEAHSTRYKNYIPKLCFYGLRNQYHRWLFGGEGSKGLIRGDFGISYSRKVPVIHVIRDKLPWSLFFSVVSVILAYIISIPIGLRMAGKPGSLYTSLVSRLLFLAYALPPFFAGVLLLMLFANPGVLSIFPPSGVMPIDGYPADAGAFNKIMLSLPYMVLPLACYTYASLAFLSQLTATSVSQQLPLDYIKTALAKGLGPKAVIWRHALRNALLPLITVFSHIFPAMIGGSVIIETIFTIPGMGAETIRAIYAQDYPLVIAILTLSGILTVAGYLIADLLYAIADPRIRLSKSSTT